MLQPKVEVNGLTFSLNENHKRATLIKSHTNENDDCLKIPFSVKYKSKKYIVTKIAENSIESFKDLIILFPENSKLKIVESNSFNYAKVKEIKFPSHLKIIKQEAFYSSDIKRIEFPNDSMLEKITSKAFKWGKIEYIKLPPSLIRIGKRAFDSCPVKEVEFTYENSQLKIIENKAFYSSEIKQIKIPSSVVRIEDGAFVFCPKLKKVEFEENSKLEYLGHSFAHDNELESIEIPSSVSFIAADFINNLPKLTNFKIINQNGKQNILLYDNQLILIKSDLSSDIFDILCFATATKTEIKIPSFVKYISNFALSNLNLKKIEFESNSQLERVFTGAFIENEKLEAISFPSTVIDVGIGFSNLFQIGKNENYINYEDKFILRKSNESNGIYDTLVTANPNIENALIPSFIRIIDKVSFLACQKIKSIEFEKDSKLEIIDTGSFSQIPLTKITIPSSVKLINDSAFICSKLNCIIFEKNSQLVLIDIEAFIQCPIEFISIPSKLATIGKNSFEECSKLKEVFFPNDSELLFIERFAFNKSSIERIKIPSKTLKINKYAFSNCKKLKQIEFEKNSELRSIGKFCFYSSSISCISLPSKLLIVKKSAFSFCKNLQLIEMPEISESIMFIRSFNSLDIIFLVQAKMKNFKIILD